MLVYVVKEEYSDYVDSWTDFHSIYDNKDSAEKMAKNLNNKEDCSGCYSYFVQCVEVKSEARI